jgi:hypothetical protein
MTFHTPSHKPATLPSCHPATWLPCHTVTLRRALVAMLVLFSTSLLAQSTDASKNDPISFPYRANYSSQIEMGNQKHAKLVMDFWKDWDNNTLDKSAAMMADSIMVLLSTGQVLAGKDNVMKTRQALRADITSVWSTIDVWVPFFITDKKEHWVALWGSQNRVMKDGTKNIVLINEIWRVNKNGKIDMIRQYAGVAPGGRN